MTNKIDIEELNNAFQDDFTKVLAEIYEHSSWIPREAWLKRPFSSVDNLHQTMLKIVQEASLEDKLALLRAHPQLAGKEAKDGTLTNASTEEQASANLNALSKAEIDKIFFLNKGYMEKHQFPFIIAVKNHNKASIFNEFQKRINNDQETELSKAIEEVGLIASFRLAAILKI